MKQRDRESENLVLSGCGVGRGAGPRVCERLMTIYILYYSRRWSRSRECSVYISVREECTSKTFSISSSPPRLEILDRLSHCAVAFAPLPIPPSHGKGCTLYTYKSIYIYIHLAIPHIYEYVYILL